MTPFQAQCGRLRAGVTRSEPVARVVLDDHARLPWRFFGRLTATLPARPR
ncbi:hypothetical protein GJ689_01225 [Rhodoplanes serenus]|uniref:Uncharacterized protein n=1 Tax=Rhodoplanes serenus TaxID=200615 RepID=A0A9X5AR05_9BRAD|nr:hypothetical protein [Rhodoplanes serenus]